MRRTLPNLPGRAGEVADAIMARVLEFVGDAALVPVIRRRVLRRYRESGHEIADVADIRTLDVGVPDRLAQGLTRRWMVAAGSVGGAIGTFGAAGLPADVLSLLGVNLMAIGDFACTWGFDIAREDERAFAVALLLADRREDSEPGMTAADRIAELRHRAAQIRLGGKPRERSDTALDAWLRAGAWRLARRLLGRRLGQLVPFVGAVIGAGLDATFTRETCELARAVYRQRFLDVSAD